MRKTSLLFAVLLSAFVTCQAAFNSNETSGKFYHRLEVFRFSKHKVAFATASAACQAIGKEIPLLRSGGDYIAMIAEMTRLNTANELGTIANKIFWLANKAFPSTLEGNVIDFADMDESGTNCVRISSVDGWHLESVSCDSTAPRYMCFRTKYFQLLQVFNLFTDKKIQSSAFLDCNAKQKSLVEITSDQDTFDLGQELVRLGYDLRADLTSNTYWLKNAFTGTTGRTTFDDKGTGISCLRIGNHGSANGEKYDLFNRPCNEEANYICTSTFTGRFYQEVTVGGCFPSSLPEAVERCADFYGKLVPCLYTWQEGFALGAELTRLGFSGQQYKFWLMQKTSKLGRLEFADLSDTGPYCVVMDNEIKGSRHVVMENYEPFGVECSDDQDKLTLCVTND